MKTKKLEITTDLAIKLLGQNTALDAIIKANFSESELSTKITDCIKTVDDALNYLNIDIDKFNTKLQGLDQNKRALEKLEVITLALNEGVKMQYDGKTYLYYPWFNSAPGFSFFVFYYFCSNSCVSSRLCFRSAELAEYAGRNFTDIYDVYLNG